MAEGDGEPIKGRRTVSDAVRERLSVRRALEGQLVSLVNLLGRPLLNNVGTRVATVDDVVVRWERDSAYPRVVAVLARTGKVYAVVAADDISISQTGVQLRSDRHMVARPVRQKGDVALARDVLDHQLVDLAGVEVRRANDIYLFDGPNGWELAGVDVASRAFLRRLGPRRRSCPPPLRAIDWAELQSFVPRFTDAALPIEPGPADAAGEVGGAVKLGVPARDLKKLRAKDVASLLAEPGRGQQAQVAALVPQSAAVEALRQLDPAQREALMAELSQDDRQRLEEILNRNDKP
jgi:hypothetical protein